MKWNKSILISAILFVAAAGFTTMKLQDAAYIKNRYNCVSIRFQTEGASENSLEAALEKEKKNGSLMLPEITAWSQPREAKVRNPVLNRQKKVRVNLVDGDMKLTAPMTLLYGNYIYRDDNKGCVIDSDTAFGLYGTLKAVGNPLIYQNREYYVRGVVKTTGHLMLLASNDKNKEFPNLEINYQNKEMGEELSEEFLMQNGFSQNYTAVDGCIYARMINTIYILPVWVSFLILCCWLLKGLWKKRQKIRLNRFILYCVAGALMTIGYGILLYHITGNPLYIPDKFIPSKLSDFDYWVKQYTSVKEQLFKLRYLMPNTKDVFLENEITRLPQNFTILVLLYLAFLLHIKVSLVSKRE